MSNRLKKYMKLSYKRKIMLVLLVFGTAAILFLAAYSYGDHRNRMFTKAVENTDAALLRVSDEIAVELHRINEFYFSSLKDDRVSVLLQKNLTESDYSSIHDAYVILGGNNLINDYVAEFTIVNFNTAKVLSSKGFYNVREMMNINEIDEIFNLYQELGRSYWYVADNGTTSELISLNYRTTVFTKGVNFVFILPANSIDIKGMLMVRINESNLYDRVCNYINKDQAVAVYDGNGELLYCSDAGFQYACASGKDMSGEKVDTIYGDSYVVSSDIEGTIDRRIYVGTNWNAVKYGEESYSYLWVIVVALVIVLFLVTLFQLVYQPVLKLAKMVGNDSDNEDIDELEQVVNHIEEINNQRDILQKEISSQKLDMLELYERKLINGEMTPSEIEESINEYDVFIKPYYYTMSVILKGKEDEHFGERRQEKNILVSSCMEIEKEFHTELLWQPIYLRGALWVVFEDDEIEVLNHIVPEFFERLSSKVFKRYGMRIKAGVSSVRSSVTNFSETMQESIRALNKSDDKKRSDSTETSNEFEISNINFYAEYVKRGESVYDRAFEKEISSAIIGGNRDQVYNSCDVFFNYLKNPQFSRSEIVAYVFQFVSAITLAFMEVGLDADNMYRIGTNEIYARLFELYDPDKMRQFIKWNLIDSAWEKVESKQEAQSGAVLLGIDRLIEEKKGNITLTECAELLGVHPTYIWKLLKKERGKSFSEYQESYRLSEAKRLLLETEMSVADIALALHYTNAQNFIRFFSKETGMTPGKFRKNER